MSDSQLYKENRNKELREELDRLYEKKGVLGWTHKDADRVCRILSILEERIH